MLGFALAINYCRYYNVYVCSSAKEGVMRNNIWALLNKIAPQEVEELVRRINILSGVAKLRPVGRRKLASYLNTSERKIRSSAEQMAELGLITTQSSGMRLTKKGDELRARFEAFGKIPGNASDLQKRMSKYLDVPEVYIAPGDVDKSASLEAIAFLSAMVLTSYLRPGCIIAIAGGSTMATIADEMSISYPDITVVPARGGIGSQISTQADFVASRLAEKLGCQCRLMYLPDDLDYSTLRKLEKSTTIKEVLGLVKKADIILLGIGRADSMANRRGLENSQMQTLLSLGAVGESAGHFFNIEGHTVYQSPSVGGHINFEGENHITISCAGGYSKAEAIIGAVRHHKPAVLVIDEGAAKGIAEKM